MDLDLVRLPDPEIGPDDVLVRVRACGICGSDVHGMMTARAAAFHHW